MKIFLSSVIREFGEFREAAVNAIETLGHRVLRAEELGARTESPRTACLGLVREADLTILLLGSRYGDIQDSGISATHEEYREAKQRGDVLVFVQQRVDREQPQEAFVAEVRDYAQGHTVVHFDTPSDLRKKVIREIHRYVQQTPPVDEVTLHERAIAATDVKQTGIDTPRIVLALAGRPDRILSPSQLEDPATARQLLSASVDAGLFDEFKKTDQRIQDGWLELRQEHAEVALHERTSLRCISHITTMTSPGPYGVSSIVIIEEGLVRHFIKIACWAGIVLRQFDPTRRFRDFAVAVGLQGCGGVGWKTEAEHTRSPNTTLLSPGIPDRLVVPGDPMILPRRALDTEERNQVAQDLMVLARRSFLQR